MAVELFTASERPSMENFNRRIEQANALMPARTIVMWGGALDEIPDGWALCDGTNGTPDLRNRFIVGAGSSYAVGAMGGSTTHTHGVRSVSRVEGDGYQYHYSSEVYNVPRDANHLPPYYALCYIMKL